MQASSLLVCLWPGLPRLWWRGDWRALLVAVFFAVAVNFSLLTSFVWPEMLPFRWQLLVWTTVSGLWGISFFWGTRQLAALVVPRDGTAQQDLFVQAQSEYLRGHWLEAESLLRQLMQRNDRDVDSPLLLATLYRRTGRVEACAEQLAMLESMDGAEKWSMEIGRERQLLKSGSEQQVEARAE